MGLDCCFRNRCRHPQYKLCCFTELVVITVLPIRSWQAI